jgi:hypothetical protein
MNKKLVEYITEEFHKLLEQKTNYGRNQIKQLHEESINKAVLRLLDETNIGE